MATTRKPPKPLAASSRSSATSGIHTRRISGSSTRCPASNASATTSIWRGEISLLSAVGNLRSEQGRYDEAPDIQQRILSALRDEGDEVRRSKAHNSLGATFYNMGDSTLAIEHFETALALNDAVRGANHPDNIYPLANLAWVLIEAKELDRAAPLLDRAIGMLRDKIAVDYYALATLLSHRGALYDERGDHEEALRVYAEGLALAASELGEEHEVTGLLLNNQAASYEALGQVGGARGAYDQAVRVLEQSGNPQDDGLALARANLARLAGEGGVPGDTSFSRGAVARRGKGRIGGSVLAAHGLVPVRSCRFA